MKRATYMGKEELMNFLKISALAGEVEDAIKYCKEKDWRRKLKTIVTYVDNIQSERLQALDKEQAATIERRFEHNKILFNTSDKYRIAQKDFGKPEEEITVNTEDLYDIVDMALLSCMKCPQGDICATCNIRKILHTWGIPVIRTNPAAGECEFRSDNDIKCVTPQYRVIKERM